MDYVSTSENVADIITKELKRVAFFKFRTMIVVSKAIPWVFSPSLCGTTGLRLSNPYNSALFPRVEGDYQVHLIDPVGRRIAH